jgi:hypothetical protein
MGYGIEIGCEVEELEVTGVIKSAHDDRVELALLAELLRFKYAAGDLFHKLRVNEKSDLVVVGVDVVVLLEQESQWLMNEASAPSRIKL